MRTKEGFTLVEVLASVLIFLIGAAAILNVSIGSMRMSKRAEYAYTAYNLAKNHLETLRSMPFGDLSSSDEISTIVDQNGVPDLSGEYLRSTAITTNYSSDSNLVMAKVSVSYVLNGQESAAPMEMSTVIYNSG